MSCDSQCSVALPHGAMGWSAICDYDIHIICLPAVPFFFLCVCVCVRACVRASERACVRACVCVCVCGSGSFLLRCGA